MPLRSNSESFLAKDDSCKAEHAQLQRHLLIVERENRKELRVVSLKMRSKGSGGRIMTTAFKYC